MIDEPEETDLRRYGFTYALDRDGFFRRACPSCGREFKVKADPGDLAFLLQPAFREIGPDFGEEMSSEAEDIEALIFCPYCGHYADLSDTLTEELRTYLNRWAMREVILPAIREMNSSLERKFAPNRGRSRGMISSLSFRTDSISLPPRPISGPEPPDMKRVTLLCCSKEIKVLDGWRDLVVCPFCGAETALQ